MEHLGKEAVRNAATEMRLVLERLGRMWGTVLDPSKEMGSYAIDHTQQAQNRFHWLPAVKAALNFRVF